MITPAAARIKAALDTAFAVELARGDLWSGGIYNRRKIAGSKTWSQHSWGNALDLMTRDLATGDRVRAWLRSNALWLPVGTVLWRVPAHFDHLHIEGKPKRRGVPPVESKTEVEMQELTKRIQTALLAAGYQLPKYGADGDPGAETEAALAAAFRDARSRAAAAAPVDIGKIVQQTIGEIRSRLN